MKKTCQNNQIFYTTQWESSIIGSKVWVPDYYQDSEGNRLTDPESTWLVMGSTKEVLERIEEQKEDHPGIKHRGVLILKSEWLNDELNEETK